MVEKLEELFGTAAQIADRVPERYREVAFREAVRVLSGPERTAVGASNDGRLVQSPVPLDRRSVPFAEYFGALDPAPKNNVVRIATAAAYVEDHLGASTVSQETIKQLLQEARVIPKNFTRDMGKAMMHPTVYLQILPSGDGSELQLTRTGRELIDSLKV